MAKTAATAPKESQDIPGPLQEGSKTAPRHGQTTPGSLYQANLGEINKTIAPKTAPSPRRGPQEAREKPPRGSRMLSKRPPRGLQEVPERPPRSSTEATHNHAALRPCHSTASWCRFPDSPKTLLQGMFGIAQLNHPACISMLRWHGGRTWCKQISLEPASPGDCLQSENSS